MISPAPIEVSIPESSVSVDSQKSGEGRDSRFSHLRGVQWRISLGILPSSASIEELRRVTADTRRRYAGLRRRLLIDPHCPKDGSNSPDLVIDNPLSQNPDSCWGRFFRNAELEKMVDQDLSRLYPEHGSYFQTPACQGMLRRILLLWCLRHPECSYRQGMHELLAPLLYVLHVDAQNLSEVRKLYEDQFIDKFDDMSFPESDLLCNYKSLNWDTEIEGESSFQGSSAKVRSLDELDPEIQTIVLLSDAYGAEGELGILLSERFMEHDAYCMFDALMGGACGAVAMVDYFSPYPATGSHTGLPPVIEASSALHHLLSIVDSSLHSHLVDLGVEPQYFALRWLRVLFGREFLLDDLLIIWDEIFVSDNRKSSSGADNEECGFEVLCSPRGAFISAMAVSMLLHLRSSLLATEHATSCLQRLLNFPENVNVKKLIEKAKSLKVLALQNNISSPFLSLTGTVERNNAPPVVRGQSLPSGSISPNTPLNLVPESYWEEKWRVAQKAEEELLKEHTGNRASFRKKGLSEKLKLSLVRSESDPSPAKTESGKKESRLSVRRRLLEDLARALGSEEDLEKLGCSEVSVQKDSFSEALKERKSHEETIEENDLEKNFSCVDNSICSVSCVACTCTTGHTGSEENSSIFSASSSPLSTTNVRDNESEKCSVASNLSDDENDDIEHKNKEKSFERTSHESPLPLSDLTGCDSQKPELNEHADRKLGSGLKERKLLPGKFPWFWKFGQSASEGTSGKGGVTDTPRSQSIGINQNSASVSSTSDGCGTSSGDMADKNMMATLKNLGQSMLENIQVIESVFQQDRSQVGSLENLSRNILAGKGQVKAVAALKELRKISNLLSEM